MASAALLALPKPSPFSPTPPKQGKNGRDAVYVAAAPLRAARGPAQALLSAAYSLGVWDLQHFMVIVKPDPSQPQAVVFDFQPQDPENFYVALAALSGRQVPGVVLKRKLRRMPRSRYWFVGFSDVNTLDVADKFNQDWPTTLIIGKHDCRHYTSDQNPNHFPNSCSCEELCVLYLPLETWSLNYVMYGCCVVSNTYDQCLPKH